MNAAYKLWKRRNVTLRGMKEVGKPNGVYGSFGDGLYSAFLSNKAMAKEYGKVHYVLGGVPSHPKKVQGRNAAEIFIQNIVRDFCIENGIENRLSEFEKLTTISAEVMRKGYNGLIIQGREMVHYNPENVLYFETENELYNYYLNLQKYGN